MLRGGWFGAKARIPDIASCPGYRLPTEAEWDYAARSGTTSEFWTGSGLDNGGTTTEQGCDYDTVIIDGNLNPYLRDYAWFCGNISQFQPVAQLLPNGFGLYDVHGNGNEHVNDRHCSSFPCGTYQNPDGSSHIVNWQSTVGTLRGSFGNYVHEPVDLLVGNRMGHNANNWSAFRLARTVF